MAGHFFIVTISNLTFLFFCSKQKKNCILGIQIKFDCIKPKTEIYNIIRTH